MATKAEQPLVSSLHTCQSDSSMLLPSQSREQPEYKGPRQVVSAALTKAGVSSLRSWQMTGCKSEWKTLPYHPLISALLSKMGSANSQQLQAPHFPRGHLRRQKWVSHPGLDVWSQYVSCVWGIERKAGRLFFFPFRTQVQRKPNVKLPVSAPSDMPVSFPLLPADYFTKVVAGR